MDESDMSQSAFVRGFIDDDDERLPAFVALYEVSIRVRARLHR